MYASSWFCTNLVWVSFVLNPEVIAHRQTSSFFLITLWHSRPLSPNLILECKNYVLLSNYNFFGSINLKIINFNGLTYHSKVRTFPTQSTKKRSSDSDSKLSPSLSCSNRDLPLRTVIPKGLKISKMVGGWDLEGVARDDKQKLVVW